jgi:transposase InsO family protein
MPFSWYERGAFYMISKSRKKFKKTTDSRHKLPVAPNLVNQQFQVDRPNAIWCGDITYLWTLEGWLYLAVIIDLYSRKVVGWALDSHLRTSLALEALRMAYWRQKPAKGLIHHSDRGSQYAAHDLPTTIKNLRHDPQYEPERGLLG